MKYDASLRLNDETRRTVQDSWTAIMSDTRRSANIFYSELFRVDPSIQYLFRGDLTEQKARLMAMFNVAVRGLDNWDDLEPLIEDLGRRHAQYRVLPQHYDTMEQALLAMVEQRLGDDYTEEVSSAWRSAFALWSAAMKRGAEKN